MRIQIRVLLVFIILSTSLFAEDNKNKTLVTPHLDVKLNSYQNIVYSSSFHYAWKELQNQILRGDVKTERPIQLVHVLNSNITAEINDDDHLSLCGFAGAGICKKIQTGMLNKFNQTVDLSDYTGDPFNIICYSYFRKYLEFSTKFETIEQPQPFFYNGKSCLANYFGIWTANNSSRHTAIRSQVEIIDHIDKNNFIISISNKSGKDELLLVMSNKFNPIMTFSDAIENSILKINTSPRERLVDNDRLLIPKIEIDGTHQYDELYGVHLANEGFKDYFFIAAIHNIRFKLNESGAYADSEAKLILKKGPGPRIMIFNKPFLIMMKEKTSDNPYFAAWIVNADLLVKTDFINSTANKL